MVRYLIDGEWSAKGELPGLGSYTAKRTYRWTLEGSFVEQMHVMHFASGQVEAKGLIGWDPDRQEIVTWGFGSDGGVATTRATHVTPGEIRFEGVRVGGFTAGPIRSTYKKLSENEFHEVAETKQDGEWMPMFTFEFTREKLS